VGRSATMADTNSQPSKGKVVMTDEASLWLQNLKALGQSQGYLTYAQVNESLPLAIVHPEKIEEIVEQLKRSGIRIVPG
jgi:hypothetical protein